MLALPAEIASIKWVPTVTGSANADVTATLPASANDYWVVRRVVWSYSDTPTGGRLTVTIGSTVVLDIDITNGGPGNLTVDPLMANALTKNEAVDVKLFAAGGSVVGKVAFSYR